MLYLDTALELDGLTVFRDFNAPNRFYYMPGAPRLTMDAGAPAFQLLIYRRDITDNPDFQAGGRLGGGFLTMTVNIGVASSVLQAVEDELRDRTDAQDVDLVPVPVEEGSVRVTALGVSSAPAAAGSEASPGERERGPRFVEQILGSATPSLYGDNRCVFQIELSQEGALLMRQSLEGGGTTQIAVVYELAYRGLLPAYEGKIRIDFKQSYSYLRSRFTLNTLWFKADIDSEVERLTKEGHIKIESVDYLQSDPAKLAENATKLQELAKELATWAFFRPGLTPGKVMADDRGNITVHDPSAAAAATTPTPQASLLAAGSGRGAPGDVAGPRNQATSGNASTTRVGGDPLPAPTEPAPATPQAGAPESSSAVDAWNKMGRPQAAFLLRQLSQEEQQTITYDLRQVAAARRTAAPQGAIRVLPGATDLPGRIIQADLDNPFFDRIAGIVSTSADLDAAGVTSMVVRLRYGERENGTTPKDSAEIPLRARGASGTFQFSKDHRFSTELEYRVVVNYEAGFALGATTSEATSPWLPAPAYTFDVDPRVVGDVFSVTLNVGSIDWDVVKSLQSTVVYDAGADRERTVVLTAGAPTAVVPIRPPTGADRRFTVRSTFFYERTQEIVELTGSGTSTIVINPPTTRAVPVTITAVDPLARFRKLTVELAYPAAGGQPTQSTFVELGGDGESGAWTFFRPSDTSEPRYRYRTTLFGVDGTTDTGEWTDTLERQLVIGDVFEGLIDVEVRFLLSDLAAAGFLGAKVSLRYPEAPAGADGDIEKFFQDVPEPLRWRVPRPRGASERYEYTVQWVRTDSTQHVVGPVTTSDELLMIFPPPPAGG